MKIGAIDVETNGFDYRKDKITEIGFVIFDVDSKLPVWLYSSLNDPRQDIPDEVVKLNGITNEMCKGEKVDFELLKKKAGECTYIIAHNALFDMKFILAVTKNKGGFAPGKWLCSWFLPDWGKIPGVRKSMSQSHIGADLGIFNTFPHRAVFDAATLGRIVFETKGVLDEMIAKAGCKWSLIAAVDTDFNKKDLLKEHGYRSYYVKTKFKFWYKIVPHLEDSLINEKHFLLQDVYPKVKNPKDAIGILAEQLQPFKIKEYDHWYQPLLALDPDSDVDIFNDKDEKNE